MRVCVYNLFICQTVLEKKDLDLLNLNSENADMNTVVELMMTSYCFTFTVYQLMFNIHLIGYYLRIFTIYNNSQRYYLFCVQNLNKCINIIQNMGTDEILVIVLVARYTVCYFSLNQLFLCTLTVIMVRYVFK